MRTSFTPESTVADDFAPEEVLFNPDHSYDDIEARRAASSADEIVIAEDVAPTEEPVLNPDHSYDDIEARRAASSADEIVIAEDVAPTEDPVLPPDHRYDDIEARRAANSADEIVVTDDVAPTEDPVLNPDHRYDDIEARRAANSADEIVVADDVAPTEDPVLTPDRSYDDIEARRAANSADEIVVADDVAPTEEPAFNPDRSYDDIEARRVANSAAEAAASDSTTGLRVRYPWGKPAMRAITTRGSARVAAPTALVNAESLASREETNQSAKDIQGPSEQDETSTDTPESAELNLEENRFFSGEEVNINGRIAHRLEDGSYAFVIPEGDTLFVIRNDIATAMGEAAVEPGDAVYTDEMILALKAANEIGDPDLIYTGNQFVIPVEVINASQ